MNEMKARRILGLELVNPLTETRIKQAYKKQALLVHPDKMRMETPNTLDFICLQEAYEFLIAHISTFYQAQNSEFERIHNLSKYQQEIWDEFRPEDDFPHK